MHRSAPLELPFPMGCSFCWKPNFCIAKSQGLYGETERCSWTIYKLWFSMTFHYLTAMVCLQMFIWALTWGGSSSKIGSCLRCLRETLHASVSHCPVKCIMVWCTGIVCAFDHFLRTNNSSLEISTIPLLLRCPFIWHH